MSGGEDDPFRPPRDDSAAVPDADRLFTPGQIAIAALIGGLPAGVLLLWQDLRRLHHQHARRCAWLGGAASLTALIAQPALIGGLLLNVPIAFALFHLARLLVGRYVERHQRSGRGFASTWLVFAIGLIGFLGYVAGLWINLFIQFTRPLLPS